ncbi:AAA family ATPase [Roseiconus lacunae]|uniref:AAA family ATPase n=1 Tax=Roseiconus lacunae TaxID=2605694 RepID=UPI00308DFAFA|nr:AAA family ATPase [Stieleria sp. HD01]
MKVKDLHIDGFGVWTGLSVDSLQDGMTLFYGPNEAGKTTVMQFLRSMLYGFTPDRREKYLPPIHGGTPGGAIRVTGPGGGYHIRRHAKLTDEGAAGQLSVAGQDGLVQGQHRLTMLLGQIDEAIFTNVFAIGMRELQELNTLDDTAAADELYKLSSGLDRVSLVDVIRSLREGRKQLIGGNGEKNRADADKLESLLHKREQLRDEVTKLTGNSRRYSELASLRQTQQQEIKDLQSRLGTMERETKHVETAVSVLDKWTERGQLAGQIREIEAETLLPDEAPGQLVQIDAMIEDRKTKLEEVKGKRRALRDKAAQLPVSPRMLELQGRIEAAAEQATWVEALEQQIEKVDAQIGTARQQLFADAERLGLSEDDREALAQGDSSQMPDLSRETLGALAGPAKRVKEHLFVLKQSRSEGAEYKKRSEHLADEMGEVLNRTRSNDLQQAIREENTHLATLRRAKQLSEHIEKLKRHYRSLENESVDLSTAEVLPIDRLLLMGLPFVVGGSCLVVAFSHLLGVTWFLTGEPTPTAGMLWLFFGLMSLAVYFLSKQNGQRATAMDREECDRQIETLRRQIRELEAEEDEVSSELPGSNHPIEFRVRQAESLIAELENMVPTYHAHAAAQQSYEASRAKAVKAAEQLKQARREWSATLRKLGLAESMSPRSVRKLSEGYETLQGSLRRLEELQKERDERQAERSGLAKRIEQLYLESLEISDEDQRAEAEKDEFEDEHTSAHRNAHTSAKSANERPGKHVHQGSGRGASIRSTPTRTGPLDQLNHLQEELSRQQHWIKRRRELKEQDGQLKRQHASYARSIQRGEQQRRALWAKCGVATAEQFYEMVDCKASLVELREQHQTLDQQIRSMIGTSLQYDDIAREIEGASASDLETRWDALSARITETQQRIATLQTQVGESAADMKHLADDSRLTIVQLELGCVQRKIESIARRWQTLATASCLVEEVCGKFERERQPETLREASSFLAQLTGGKYTRIWTPLGTNQLKIDTQDNKSLPLEVLSRGTREAVFIALRLSLAAAYARRGVMLPLILDDVLVNFDGDRALHAAETLQTFADLGHQVMMFTCHEHIVDIFQSIGVEVRQLPAQGAPGRATILEPEEAIEDEVEQYAELEDEAEEVYEEEPEEELVEEEEVVAEAPEPEPEPIPEPEPVMIEPPAPKPEPKPEPEPMAKAEPKPQPPPKPQPKAQPKPTRLKPIVIERRVTPVEDDWDDEEEVLEQQRPSIGWAWFQREPADGQISSDEQAAARVNESYRSEREAREYGEGEENIPDEVWDRNDAWWDGSRVAS